ncbi:MAG: hypothetical protein ACLQGP_18665 [Isosphaeraceae bacterium]
MRALDLVRRGHKPREIAGRRGGPDALHSHPSPGAPRKITDDQLRLIPDLLSHDAEAY